MENNRDKWIAALLTLMVAGLTLMMLVVSVIAPARVMPSAAATPEEAEVFFADIEYTEITRNPTPQVDGKAASAAATDPGGVDLTDQGGGESAPDLVATTEPKPNGEQVARPESPKPATPTDKEKEEAARARIAARMGAATGLKARNETQAAGHAATGTAATGNNNNATGLGLNGRKRLNSPDPGIKNARGWVKVSITVNAGGAVTGATFHSASAFGGRDAEVRNACVAASKKLRYSPDPDKPQQKGIITWNIQ